MQVPIHNKMSASILQQELSELYGFLSAAPTPAPESLVKLLASLRTEMEIPQGGVRQFNSGQNSSNWRSGVGGPAQPTGRQAHGGGGGGRFQRNGGSGRDSFQNPPQRLSSGFPSNTSLASNRSGGQSSPRTPLTPSTPGLPRAPAGRYQSRFSKSDTNLNEKILNTVIGNKLNAFTQLTYTDTRDFIYQILDSGETEFIREFVEKVFKKATSEELFCPLFAKLISEIASRYPVMYEEMNKYHKEFLKIFESVIEDATAEQTEEVIGARQYRMGYGLFLSELACQNALEKSQLFALVNLILENVWNLTADQNRNKTVEEFIDCLVVLIKNLNERSLSYFKSVRQELQDSVLEKTVALINRTAGDRPSLSGKARFALMNLRDLLSA